MMMNGIAIALFSLLATVLTSGFQVHPVVSIRRPSSLKSSDGEDNQELLLVRNYLAENYKAFSNLLQKNDAVWKALAGADGGFTVFAPNAAAFAALGDKKLVQLADARNLETTEKIGSYHVIAETVTAEQLFNSAGVITMGGTVDVGRSVKGGMFGIGGKEDGGVTVNGAKVVRSVEIGKGILHEVDALISPQILWRYMDQLRIPGSK